MPQVGPRRLVLEVFINGLPLHQVEAFSWTPPDGFSATRGDLEDLGIRVPGRGDPGDMVPLQAIPGIGIRFDEPRQQIHLTLADAQRRAHVYDARGDASTPPAARTDWGGLVNYSLYATSLGQQAAARPFSGLNASLDTRLFGPFGTLQQTGILGDTVGRHGMALRLDSTIVYWAPDAMTVARAGDTISGGLAWTRPFRYGGAQVQRDFSLRPDLVTSPVPSVNGSAALPSMVDVYLNNIKTFSQPVGAGPYEITNLPVVSASGTARVVVTDASGKEVQSTLPLFESPNLLARGLTDFSLDAGFARRFYGTSSDSYDARPLASASWRHGLTEALTVEGHAEGDIGLANGGAGALARFGPWGTLSGAAAGSLGSKAKGAQAYLAYALDAWGVHVDASSQRTFGMYQDLASVTAPRFIGRTSGAGNAVLGLVGAFSPGTAGFDPRPPVALDRLSFGSALPFVQTYANLSLINLVEADFTRSRIVSLSMTRPLPWHASLYGAVYVDLARQKSAGFSIGLSVPVGADTYATTSASGGDGTTGSLDVQKSLQPVDGSTAWHLQDIEGQTPYRSAQAAYRSAYGTLTAGATQQGGHFGGSAEVDGSLAALGGGVFAGNRVDDGFAVVDAGAAGVAVTRDNRPIGVTNAWGKLLVPDLQSYQTNRIGIDPTALPMTAEAQTTRVAVAPARHSGVYLDFGVTLDVQGATVVLLGAGGKVLPPGSKGRVEGTGRRFVVGYDGQAYVRGLAARNTIVVELGDAECRASFDYAPRGAPARKIGPVTCH